jgi:hypothetical protein
MIEFPISDVSNTLDEESRELIADLVLSWARFDSLVTQWTFRTFGMGPDAGSIFIGNMDTKSKLDKLKALYTHYGHTSSVQKIAELSKLSKGHADVRNTICHKTCGVHSKANPDRLIFSDGKIFKTKPGQMLVEMIHLDQIRAAITFAKENADTISRLVDVLAAQQEERSGQSPDNPPASPPDPQPE